MKIWVIIAQQKMYSPIPLIYEHPRICFDLTQANITKSAMYVYKCTP